MKDRGLRLHIRQEIALGHPAHELLRKRGCSNDDLGQLPGWRSPRA